MKRSYRHIDNDHLDSDTPTIPPDIAHHFHELDSHALTDSGHLDEFAPDDCCDLIEEHGTSSTSDDSSDPSLGRRQSTPPQPADDNARPQSTSREPASPAVHPSKTEAWDRECDDW